MADVHVVSLIDASETVVETYAVACMENLERAKSNAGNQLTGAVLLQRSGVSVAEKRTKAAAAVFLPRFAAAGLGAYAGISVTGHMLGGLVGGVVGWSLGARFADKNFGRTILAGMAPDDGAEPFWKGSRTYELQPTTSPAIDSKVVAQDPEARGVNTKAGGELLGQEMVRHPDKLTVAHLLGHGLAFRETAGMDFGAYKALLSQATVMAGRPVDLLLVESCLNGNLEALLATAPYARYAVVSEEVVLAGSMSGAFAKAMGSLRGQPVTPGELGARVIASNPDGSMEFFGAIFGMRDPSAHKPEDTPEVTVSKTRAETMALVDMAQIPALGQAVDKLGGLLVQEVRNGNADALREAAGGALTAGHQGALIGAKMQLGVGDLNLFVENVGQMVMTGMMHSTQPRALLGALRDVQKQLYQTVPTASIGMQYGNSAGLTVQLPTPRLALLDKKHPDTVANSAMPPRWREFVELASR